ncbi:hypothetical protein [Rufibacter sp. LB8]|uniref:hypothetical protein n=1 Tax=Rufibacter sp. LB8 TaxID=2777781 RepID=UPI00178C4DB0|nr:hypothetical protein [Rufibacter sp. LB8]
MDNTDFISIWKQQDAKIEKALAINHYLLRETINQKAKSTLQPLVRLKTVGIVAVVLFLILLGFALFFAIKYYAPGHTYFIVSVACIALINLKALADYIKHLVWVNNINYDGSVVAIQEQLTKLQLSIIRHGKIMCLQFPFYTTFFLSSTWFPQQVAWPYLVFQGIMTGGFVYLSYWLYKNHTPENLDKKWFRTMIAGSGGKSVMQALAFYREMEAFKKEE